MVGIENSSRKAVPIESIQLVPESSRQAERFFRTREAFDVLVDKVNELYRLDNASILFSGQVTVPRGHYLNIIGAAIVIGEQVKEASLAAFGRELDAVGACESNLDDITRNYDLHIGPREEWFS